MVLAAKCLLLSRLRALADSPWSRISCLQVHRLNSCPLQRNARDLLFKTSIHTLAPSDPSRGVKDAQDFAAA